MHLTRIGGKIVQ